MIIEVLFPEVANLYGDLGNIEYISRSLEAAGKECEIINTDLYTRPAFADRDDIDLIYMGPVTEKGQIRVIDSLMPYKERLAQLIKDGQRFFMTGNGYKSQFTHIYPSDETAVTSLFTTEKGEGLNPGFSGEGIKENNFAGTYLLGPLFVLNPLLLKKFLEDLGCEGCAPLFEEAAMEAYRKRLDEYREPGRNYKY